MSGLKVGHRYWFTIGLDHFITWSYKFSLLIDISLILSNRAFTKSISTAILDDITSWIIQRFFTGPVDSRDLEGVTQMIPNYEVIWPTINLLHAILYYIIVQ